MKKASYSCYSTSKKSTTTNSYNDLYEIRRKLKRGEMRQIATELWVSPGQVSNVLAGRRYDKAIVDAAKAITRRRK